MTRRELLAGAVAACAMPLRAQTRWDKSRISAITDEIGNTVEEAIAFAHQYSLTHVEIRDRHTVESRKEYFTLPEAEIKADAARFKQEGLHVTFINTSLMKFTWPGMEPSQRRPETPEARTKRLANEQAQFDSRMEDLQKAIHCAQWMGCDKVRVFTGTRLADPRTAFPRIADVIGPMTLVAEKEKVYLLIENEASQNVGTSAELADIMKAIPSKWLGMNWDPHNAYGKETSYPDGYKLLPQNRLMNIQVKAKGVMPNSPEKEDWKAIMTALDRDGYTQKLGLETHIFDGTLIAAAHASMEEILRIVNELA
jgi:sugar phosphate isomerase/epimerase